MSAAEPLTAEQLAEYQALTNAATPGPWWNDSHEIYVGEHVGIPAMCTWIGETCNIDLPDRGDANGAFIAHSRQMVPALLAEVDRLTAELAERREPSAAEVELCDRWMAKYGDDRASWPAEVHEAYQNTLAELLSGGAL